MDIWSYNSQAVSVVHYLNVMSTGIDNWLIIMVSGVDCDNLVLTFGFIITYNQPTNPINIHCIYKCTTSPFWDAFMHL